MRQQENFFETPYLSVESSCGSQRRGTKTLLRLYISLPWETVTLSDVERPKIRLEGVYAWHITAASASPVGAENQPPR